MAHVEASGDVQVSKSRPKEKSDDGWSDRLAPNGRTAVLVSGLWAGYLFDEAGGSCGRSGKTIVCFEVETLPSGTGLKITQSHQCDGKSKKALNKQIHHERRIRFYDARTEAGDRCQLFTL